MIKRLCFVTRRRDLSAADFSASWVAATAPIMRAPTSVRPSRAVACTVLRDVPGTTTPHDGVSIAWFADLAALRRFEAWLNNEGGQLAAGAASLVEPDATGHFVAEELVLRGADWLTRRWASDAVMFKHMALARRARGLSATEFSARWRSRAGTVGGGQGAPTVAIPAAAKGLAYLQNHALEGSTTPASYDAVNEVYFDDLALLRERADFFAKLDVASAEADLVSVATFVAVAEHVLSTVRPRRPDQTT